MEEMLKMQHVVSEVKLVQRLGKLPLRMAIINRAQLEADP
jgi:hypothetical protein